MSTCYTADLYNGRGQVYLAVRNADGSQGPWEPVAEARSLEIGQTQEWEEIYSRCDRNGAQIARVLRQTDFEVTLETYDMSAASLAKAVYGAHAAVISASVTGEAHEFEAVGSSISLAHPFGVTAVTVSKNGTPLDASDYEVDADHGVITALTADAVGDVTVSYTHGDYEKIEAAVNGVTNYAIRFDGVSLTNSMPIQVTLHNVALSMSSSIGFLTEDTATLTLSGKLLADRSKPAGKSQYFTISKGVEAI